jgi:hypothetical protein
MSRLNCHVYITGPDGGVHGFGPNSDVPDWARKMITNPHVWDSAPEPILIGSKTPPDALPSGGDVPVELEDGPPPQGGTGATRQRWADYASSKGVALEADWKREDIIAACETAGIKV